MYDSVCDCMGPGRTRISAGPRPPSHTQTMNDKMHVVQKHCEAQVLYWMAMCKLCMIVLRNYCYILHIFVLTLTNAENNLLVLLLRTLVENVEAKVGAIVGAHVSGKAGDAVGANFGSLVRCTAGAGKFTSFTIYITASSTVSMDDFKIVEASSIFVQSPIAELDVFTYDNARIISIHYHLKTEFDRVKISQRTIDHIECEIVKIM
jgi:hypothetical protein